MRRPGIEPGASRWQRDILPLNQRRSHTQGTSQHKHKHKHKHENKSALHCKTAHSASTLLCSLHASSSLISCPSSTTIHRTLSKTPDHRATPDYKDHKPQTTDQNLKNWSPPILQSLALLTPPTPPKDRSLTHNQPDWSCHHRANATYRLGA